MYPGAVFNMLLVGIVIALVGALVIALVRRPGWGSGIVSVAAVALVLLLLGTLRIGRSHTAYDLPVPPQPPAAPGARLSTVARVGSAVTGDKFVVSTGQSEWGDGQIRLELVVSRAGGVARALAGDSLPLSMGTASAESDEAVTGRELPDLKRAALAHAPEALEQSLEELTRTWSDLQPELAEARRDLKVLLARDRLRAAKALVRQAEAAGDVCVEAENNATDGRNGQRTCAVRITIPGERVAAAIRHARRTAETTRKRWTAESAVAVLAIVAFAYIVLRISSRRARRRWARLH
jgi:hypothetical protein